MGPKHWFVRCDGVLSIPLQMHVAPDPLVGKTIMLKNLGTARVGTRGFSLGRRFMSTQRKGGRHNWGHRRVLEQVWFRDFLERGLPSRLPTPGRSNPMLRAERCLPSLATSPSRRVADRVIGGRGSRKFGRVDTLVNNAGVFLSKSFTEFTEADFTPPAVGEPGPVFFYVSQRAIRQMLRAGGAGHVVNMTTTLVNQPVKGVPVGAGVPLPREGLMLSRDPWQSNMRTRGIRVNAGGRRASIKTSMHPPESHAFSGQLAPDRADGRGL